MKISASFEAMETDARAWDDIAEHLTSMQNAAGSASTFPGAFSFKGQHVAAEYAAACTEIERLLGQGVSASEHVAAWLRETRDLAQSEELGASADFRSMGDDA